MSTNRMQEAIFDLHEINAGIVKRQKAALARLEVILADQLDRDELVEADETEAVINILLGKPVRED